MYPRWKEDETLGDEDCENYEREFWGDECEDSLYEERRERELFGQE